VQRVVGPHRQGEVGYQCGWHPLDPHAAGKSLTKDNRTRRWQSSEGSDCSLAAISAGGSCSVQDRTTLRGHAPAACTVALHEGARCASIG
jgi:hypothetical protein